MNNEPLPDHVARNRAQWDEWAAEYVEPGKRAWAGEPHWGIWQIPETELRILPDVDGKDTIELGCGAGYVSAWLARRGARPVGIDNSEAQIATAMALQAEHGIVYPVIHGNAEAVPLPDASFDFAISEYGASIWCDPYKWIPEAARLLRPGGLLAFLVNSTILMLFAEDDETIPAGKTLLHNYFGMHRFEWTGDQSVEFHLNYGDWIELFRATGFVVERLIHLRPPEGATTRYPFVTSEWARRWPSEDAWIVRKIG
jgi:SAM-dependent methyltransferase